MLTQIIKYDLIFSTHTHTFKTHFRNVYFCETETPQKENANKNAIKFIINFIHVLFFLHIIHRILLYWRVRTPEA